ncbi:zinc finger and BTB domain-containing protein 11 isoform X1 [Pleurodeles waltl]|uniref:zinc finger and BTB domain-containing protein 11 isoform X1 n=1 Tax=Pleurodeles waltl TaxID=8319 RepID=UPI003709A582
MSSEESYLAILRYLTDHKQPYAPGTTGNAKRKIRKAAACYVARGDTLYYQRRLRGRQRFCELEVVLPRERRLSLICAAHRPVSGARHRTRLQTWQHLSQRYWWRGILKEVKDYIKECDKCQEKNDQVLTLSDASSIIEDLGIEVQMCENPYDSDEVSCNPTFILPPASKPTKKRMIAKHEFIFIDSKGSVKKTSSKHSKTILNLLNQQRLANQFCDVTLLIEGEEYKAHKAVLAASSEYFRELFIEKGAVSSHEAVVDLSGFCKSSFLPLLEFAYTSVLTFDFCNMADVALLARHLFMSEVLEICECVHKQMESQQFTVSHKGDPHNTESSKSLLNVNVNEISDFLPEEGAPVFQQNETEARLTPSFRAVMRTKHTTEILGSLEQPSVDCSIQRVSTELNSIKEHHTTVDDSSELCVHPDVHRNGYVSVAVTVSSSHPGLQSHVRRPAEIFGTVDPHLQQSMASSVESDGVPMQSVSELTLTSPTKTNVSSLNSGLHPSVSRMSEIRCSLQSDVQPRLASHIERSVPHRYPNNIEAEMRSNRYVKWHETTDLQPMSNRPSVVNCSAVLPALANDVTIPEESKLSGVRSGNMECVPAPLELLVSNVSIVPEAPFTSVLDISLVGTEPTRVIMGTSSQEKHCRKLNVSSEKMEDDKKIHIEENVRSPEIHTLCSIIDRINVETTRDAYHGRQLFVREAEYEHLEGMQKKQLSRKSNPKSLVQQVAKKLIQRGRKLKLPKRNKMEIKMHAKHKCTDCGLVFQRPYALMLHTLKHEQTKEFKCPLCKKEFQYRASLRAHLIRHSQRSEEHASVVYSRNGPARNSAKSRTKREFICDVCGRTLPKLYSLKIHMLKHTGVKPHACKVCGKSFTYKHGLKMHRTLHEVNKQFKCELCEKSFVTKRSLQEHTSLHTGESKYLCSVCGQSFHRASGLSKHVKKHQPKPDTRRFQCTQCDKCFYEARDLRQHMNKHLGVKPFQCQVCGKCYSWKKDWYSHVKSHSVTDPYRCIVCGKEFFEKALFRRHVKKATHGKKGRAKQNLQHVCEHCGKKFMQLREYRRHINNHEGVKPFECLTCGVAWADARSLKRHVRTHTGERPYVCPVCNDAYIDARTLRKHMTKCHNDYVPCKIVLEKDTLQFHNQGTQVEHAISMLSADVEQYESEIVTEEIDSVSLTGGGAHEAIEAVAGTEECTAVSTLSDQSIMQVVNYVLAQKQGQKVEASDAMEIVEAELIQASDTERVLRQKCKP